MDPETVLGLDYGTDLVRAVLVHATTGDETAADVFIYPNSRKHGKNAYYGQT